MKGIVLLSHSFSKQQRKELKRQYGVKEVVEMPEQLKEVWKNIPPEYSVEQVREHIQPIIEWINSFGTGNVVVVQGEFAATEWVVLEAVQRGNIPVMATTKRETIEKQNPDGTVEKQSVFRHVRFREYPLYTLHKMESELRRALYEVEEMETTLEEAARKFGPEV